MGGNSVIAIPEEGVALDSPEMFYLLTSPEEIEEAKVSDKIKSAYHEAGHAVVAICLGAKMVRACITPTHTMMPWGERHWIGVCSWIQNSDGAPHVVGIAGVVAEAILDNTWNEYFGDDLLIEEISDSDAEYLNDANCEEASFRAYHILHRNWAFVIRVADALISDKSLTNWQILQLREEAP